MNNPFEPSGKTIPSRTEILERERIESELRRKAAFDKFTCYGHYVAVRESGTNSNLSLRRAIPKIKGKKAVKQAKRMRQLLRNAN